MPLLSDERRDEKKPDPEASKPPSFGQEGGRTKLVAYGLEMMEKEVKLSGTCGRVYLPSHWVGCRVKIIRLD